MSEVTLDLSALTGDKKVRNLSGKERGVAARIELNIDELDKIDSDIVVVIPDYVDTISPSYFQGLFSESIMKLGGEIPFRNKYKFSGTNLALDWINIGIRNSTSSREPLL